MGIDIVSHSIECGDFILLNNGLKNLKILENKYKNDFEILRTISFIYNE